MSTDSGPSGPMTDERPMGVLPEPNEGRALHATVHGVVYARHPVRTHLVTAEDDAAAVVTRYVGQLPDDVRLVAVSERMVAITQGRSHPMSTIRPGRLARFLVRFVTRPGYGIGLGLMLTLANAYYKDVSYLVNILTMLLFYCTFADSLDTIARAACKHCGIDWTALSSSSRHRSIARARRLFILVAREHASRNLTEAAAYLAISVQAAARTKRRRWDRRMAPSSYQNAYFLAASAFR